jgi:hypothetical protein
MEETRDLSCQKSRLKLQPGEVWGVAVEAWIKILFFISESLNGQKTTIPVATVPVFPWDYNIRLNCVLLRESGVSLQGMNHHRLQGSSVSIPSKSMTFLQWHRQVYVILISWSLVMLHRSAAARRHPLDWLVCSLPACSVNSLNWD